MLIPNRCNWDRLANLPDCSIGAPRLVVGIVPGQVGPIAFHYPDECWAKTLTLGRHNLPKTLKTRLSFEYPASRRFQTDPPSANILPPGGEKCFRHAGRPKTTPNNHQTPPRTDPKLSNNTPQRDPNKEDRAFAQRSLDTLGLW